MANSGLRISAALGVILASLITATLARAEDPPLPAIAIAGFEGDASLDERDRWIPVAIEEWLQHRLRRVGGVVVVQTNRIASTRRELQDADAPLASWAEAASRLGAKTIISGVCRGTPIEMTISLKVSALGSDAPAKTIDVGPARLFECMDLAARAAAAAVTGNEAAANSAVFERPITRSVTAMESYAKAVEAQRAGNVKDANWHASRAFDTDTQFRQPLILLSQIQAQQGPQGWQAANRYLQVLQTSSRLSDDIIDRGFAELGVGIMTSLTGSPEGALSRVQNSREFAAQRKDGYDEILAINAARDIWMNRRPDKGAKLSEEEQKQFFRENMAKAAEWQRAALALAARLGDLVEELQASNKLALICERLEQPDDALKSHMRVLEIAKQIGSKKNTTLAWMFVAQFHRQQQHWDEALAAAREAQALTPEAEQSTVRMLMGEIHKGRKALPEAVAEFEAARSIAEKKDDLTGQFACSATIAQLKNDMGDRPGAVKALKDAIELANALKLPEEARLREQLKEWEK